VLCSNACVPAQKDTLQIDVRQLTHWRLLDRFRQLLPQALESKGLHPSFSDPKRLHNAANYLCLFLFGLYNPALKTMRALCKASALERVQEEVCERKISLGTFSEIQHLLDPALLEKLFGELSSQLALPSQNASGDPRQWLARDSSLFAALPRMAWALYGGGDPGSPNRAVRLHLSLNILKDVPQRAQITTGKACERALWSAQWKEGEAYVGDRNFGQDYQKLAQLDSKGGKYVVRLVGRAAITPLEELPLSPEDRQAEVFWQGWANLGASNPVRVRIVKIKMATGETLTLATNLSSQDLSAQLVGALYRQRWKIEMFFRWVKCLLNNRHWFAESRSGAAIQLYLALIASLLIQLYLGERPNKRMMELFQLHQTGWASEGELIAGLQEQAALMEKKKRK